MLAALLSAAALHRPGAGDQGAVVQRPVTYVSGSIYPAVPPVTAPGPDIDERYHPGETLVFGSQLSRAELDAVLAMAGWPPGLRDEAAAVAWCESRWSPGAVGDGGSSLGLFQLWSGWFAWAGADPGQWDDPVTNAKVALAVHQRDLGMGRSGWAQWSCQP